MQETNQKRKGDWIKLHRDIQDHRVFSDPTAFWVFMKCVMRANWEDNYFEGHDILRGQFAFSYRRLAEDLQITPNTLRSNFDKLKKWGCIRVKNAKKFSVVTVVNYNTYQPRVSKNDTPANTPANTPADTPTDTPAARALNTSKEEQEIQACKESPPASDVGSEEKALAKRIFKDLDKMIQSGANSYVWAICQKAAADPLELQAVEEAMDEIEKMGNKARNRIGIFISEYEKRSKVLVELQGVSK